MNQKRRMVVFFAALVVATGTLVTIGLSVEAIRDSVQFNRIMRRIERGDTTTETLRQAAEFARTAGDWQTLMRIAWDLEGPQRWEAVFALSQPAMRRFPEEDRWRYAGALAALRTGNSPEAKRLLPITKDAPADDLEQLLRVLTEIDLDDREQSLRRLQAFADLPAEYSVLRAIAMAETDPSIEALREAWEHTSVGAYGINAALEAAAEGDRDATRSLIANLREVDLLPSAERESAPLYLSVWLGDIDWLFEQLRTLSGTRAVEPEILLIHAEGLVQQGRLREARRFYRELQHVAPGYDSIAFLNDAAITHRIGDGESEDILISGLQFHQDSAVLRGELAGVLVEQGERIAASQILGPSLVALSTGEQRHRDWLLTRAVLGSRRPLSRLESDLWLYLNDNPAANLVAKYLARFLSVRGDEVGAARLRGRYAPDYAEWATTLHLRQAIGENELSAAEALLDLYSDASWTARFNRVLFALYHLPLPEVSVAVDEFDEWVNRGPGLTPDAYARAQLHALLVKVEYERLAGRNEVALELLENAQQLAPDDLDLASYQRLVAPPQ